ncbi:MAG: hypothetical protein CME40_05285 [Haliea sp.]|nr:hypothetical protein [Haliea sp.]|tara:strand:- start:7595 stop:8152 length:558 start_codon:yes stop_codon:yes gene_type:complete
MSKTESVTVSAVSTEFSASRNWFLALGVISTLLGAAAIVFPLVAALTIELLIGWILVISGISGLIHAWRAGRWHGFHFSLVSSLFALGLGMLLLLFPRSGILSLALLVAFFFIITGIMRIMTAWRLRALKGWTWLLVSGIMPLVLAVLILMLWPEAAGWVIGVLLGIDLLFSGITLILLSTATRT